jgi:histidine triad (HIT) family protein
LCAAELSAELAPSRGEQYVYDSDCDFCLELGAIPEGLFPKLVNGTQPSRVIFELGNLRVFPSLGEIIPGHLLIAPTYHVTATTKLNQEDRAALTQLVQKISDAFRRTHGEYPIFFEHGDPTGAEIAYGQCISHAHLHVLPQNIDMLPRLKKERGFIQSAKMSDLQIRIEEPYVSFAAGGDQCIHFFSAVDAPRQYMRALYSELIGNNNAHDWYSRIDPETTLNSAKKYRNILQE